MYRIELAHGEETAFRSIEELATAIKSGVITPKCRIYHSATDKWLPIEFHPHYKKAVRLASQGQTQEGHETAVVMKLKYRPSGEQRPPAADTMPALITEPALGEGTAPAPLPAMEALEPIAPDPALASTPDSSAPAAATDSLAIQHGPVEPTPAEPPPAPPQPKKTRDIPYIDLGPDAAFRPPRPRPEPLPRMPSAPPSGVGAPTVLAESAAPKPVATAKPAAAPKPAATPKPAVAKAPAPPAERKEAPAPAPRPAPSHADAAAHAGAGEAEPWRDAGATRRSSRVRRPVLIALAGAVLVAVTQVTLPAELPEVRLPTVSLGGKSGAMAGPAPASPSAAAPSPAMAGAAATPPPVAVQDSAAPGDMPVTPASFTPEAIHLPAPETPRFGGTSVRVDAPPPPVAAESVAAAPKIAAPDLGELAKAVPTTVTATGTLADRYAAAYATARNELDLGLRNAGFTDIFDPERLEPGRVDATRTAVFTAANHLKVYQRRAAEIERAYRDSAQRLTPDEARAWGQRPKLEEAAGAAQLTAALLQSIDSVYGLLSAQENNYVISGGGISFSDTGAAAEYGLLRRQVVRQLEAIAGSPAAGSASVQRVLRAIGGVRLPEER